ncbi:MAG: sigma-70 family RNA polymerase sigma factor [Pseudomonadales bacterium]
MLNSRINDWYRRNTVRNRHRSWLSNTDEEGEDSIQAAPDPYGRSTDEETVTNESMDKLQIALEGLPARQQQAFLLRAWEGLNVRQTATAMECAEGSVKIHYSRAIHSLRAQLG